jgi:arginyl-tRNA synthetase
MNIKNKIKSLVKKSLDELVVLDVDLEKIHIEHPTDLKMGDYSTNVAMVLAKKLKQNPIDLAKKITEKIQSNLSTGSTQIIQKIEVAGPGFINFYLSQDFFVKRLQEILEKGDGWGKLDLLKDKKILNEHSSPNLFKPFHIGHLVNNSIGESLGRILDFAGAKVKNISFPSDISLGIAKTIWAIFEKNLDKDFTINDLGDCYAYGVKKFDEDENIKQKIIKINEKIYNQEACVEFEIYKKGKKLTLEYFQQITKKLGSKFNDLIFESESGVIGKEIVENNLEKIFERSEGAVIFDGEKHDLHKRVFINSKNLPTYEAKDIGLLNLKFERFDFDKSITITDIEQKQYFVVIQKVAGLINNEWAEKSIFLQHGRMQFVGIKMGSRYGNVPLAENILEIITENILEKMEDKNIEKAEKIAIGAIKYSILKSSISRNLTFDFKKSISFEGDSGPYLQYTFARANSILEKAKKENLLFENFVVKSLNKIGDLEKTLYYFPEIVERSAKEYAPHYICTYLIDLAQKFNSFYANEKILSAENEELVKYRLALTKAVAQTLKNGLYLLGIETVDRM